MKTTRPLLYPWRLMLASVVIVASAAGCETIRSTIAPSWTPGEQASSAEIPRVQDCVIMNVSSPTKYVCNGKTYTSFQLAKLRMDEDKKYATGN
jgi:hypothetical protein